MSYYVCASAKEIIKLALWSCEMHWRYLSLGQPKARFCYACVHTASGDCVCVSVRKWNKLVIYKSEMLALDWLWDRSRVSLPLSHRFHRLLLFFSILLILYIDLMPTMPFVQLLLYFRPISALVVFEHLPVDVTTYNDFLKTRRIN